MEVPQYTENNNKFVIPPDTRGYYLKYRAEQVNYCPGCGRTHWHIGRSTAECAFCGTALPLEIPVGGGTGVFWRRESYS